MSRIDPQHPSMAFGANRPRVQDLEPGRLYAILFRQQAGNYQWFAYEMRAKFMGWRETITGKQETDRSGRPAFGTTTIPDWKDVHSVKPTTKAIMSPYKMGKIPKPE